MIFQGLQIFLTARGVINLIILHLAGQNVIYKMHHIKKSTDHTQNKTFLIVK